MRRNAARLRVLEQEGMLPWSWPSINEFAENLLREMAANAGWSYSGSGSKRRSWDEYHRQAFEFIKRIKDYRRGERGAFSDKTIRYALQAARRRAREAHEEFAIVGSAQPFVFHQFNNLHWHAAEEAYSDIQRRLTYFPLEHRLAIFRRHRQDHARLRALLDARR